MRKASRNGPSHCSCDRARSAVCLAEHPISRIMNIDYVADAEPGHAGWDAGGAHHDGHSRSESTTTIGWVGGYLSPGVNAQSPPE